MSAPDLSYLSINLVPLTLEITGGAGSCTGAATGVVVCCVSVEDGVAVVVLEVGGGDVVEGEASGLGAYFEEYMIRYALL